MHKEPTNIKALIGQHVKPSLVKLKIWTLWEQNPWARAFLFAAAMGCSTVQEKAAQGKSGFVPAITRWVIERSNAWMERCKILIKNHERTLANATTKLNLCFVRLMIKRLAPS